MVVAEQPILDLQMTHSLARSLPRRFDPRGGLNAYVVRPLSHLLGLPDNKECTLANQKPTALLAIRLLNPWAAEEFTVMPWNRILNGPE